MRVPKGALGYLNTLYYKIGRHGYVYYWNDNGWRKSEWPAEQIKKMIIQSKEKIVHF